MKRFLNWLGRKFSPGKASTPTNLHQTGAHLRQTGSHLGQTGSRTRPQRSKPTQAVPRRQPEVVNFDGELDGRIEDLGPGKNVLIRNRFVREDTGTHESLKILDDSMIETDEEAGFDPYNTGNFDRSRNWDKRQK
jgi:hypothetical protein